MDPAFSMPAAALGAAGAVLHEATRWVSFRYDETLPTYLRKLHYWILSAVLVILGAVLAGVIGPAKVIEALAIGIAAPSMISRIGSAVPPKPMLGEGGQLTLRTWLKG